MWNLLFNVTSRLDRLTINVAKTKGQKNERFVSLFAAKIHCLVTWLITTGVVLFLQVNRIK